MASLEDLVKPLGKIKAFFTVSNDVVFSQISEVEIPESSWLSRAERSLSALSVHFLSKAITLHKLRNKKQQTDQDLSMDKVWYNTGVQTYFYKNYYFTFYLFNLNF